MKTTSEMDKALYEGSMTVAEVMEGLRAILAALRAELGEEWVRTQMVNVVGAPELPEAGSVEATRDLCEYVAVIVDAADWAAPATAAEPSEDMETIKASVLVAREDDPNITVEEMVEMFNDPKGAGSAPQVTAAEVQAALDQLQAEGLL